MSRGLFTAREVKQILTDLKVMPHILSRGQEDTAVGRLLLVMEKSKLVTIERSPDDPKVYGVVRRRYWYDQPVMDPNGQVVVKQLPSGDPWK